MNTNDSKQPSDVAKEQDMGPVDADMPKLKTAWQMEFCRIAIGRIRPVMGETFEWLERIAGSKPLAVDAVYMWKLKHGYILEMITALEKEGYDSPIAAMRVADILRMMGNDKSAVNAAIWATMHEAAILPEGTRDPLYQLAIDDRALRAIGLAHLFRGLYCEMMSSKAGLEPPGSETMDQGPVQGKRHDDVPSSDEHLDTGAE